MKLKQACIGRSRHVTVQRVKLLVEVTVPRCVTEVMYKMLHPFPRVLWGRQRGRNNKEHKFIKQEEEREREPSEGAHGEKKIEQTKQWSKTKREEMKRVMFVEEKTEHNLTSAL